MRRTPATVLLVGLVTAAVVVRVRLFRDLPALLTNDSWDYLKAAQDIARAGDFFSMGLRDVRLPGYPTFLALVQPSIGWRSDAIVFVQSVLGLATVATGWAIGRLLGSPIVSCAMVACLGVGPVYLLNEHAVMAESFSLLLYVLLVLMGLAAIVRSSGWPWWASFGLLLGACIVTRANVVTLGAALAAAAVVARWTAADATSAPPVRRLLRALAPGLIAAGVASAVIAPWLWRNRACYGRATLFASTNRNLLMYKNMHDPLDPTLPTLAAVNAQLAYDHVDFEWLWRLSRHVPPAEAETLAGRIVGEEVAARPARHVRQIGQSAAAFAGFGGGSGEDDRTAVLYWFRVLVRDVPSMSRLARQPGATLLDDWVFVPKRRNTGATLLLARVGSAYLRPGRAALFLLFAGAVAVYAGTARRRGDPAHAAIVATLAVAYVATLLTHASMLMDYDRYSSMFDFVAVLVVALVAHDLATARRTRTPADTSQLPSS